jgi:hypothetical protein
MVRCGACGGSHVHEGTLSLARNPGEIEMGGHRYALLDVRALVALPEPDGHEVAVPRSVFDLALLGGLALAAYTAARLWL